jgi:RHS repeat-associated protein
MSERLHTSIGPAATRWWTNQTGVQGVFSSSGATDELAVYSPYGKQTITSGASVTPFGFQGSYTDSTGLIYLVNRYYDPSTDQFLAIDPEVARTDEPYVFVNDDPLNAEDPLGLNCDGAGSGAAIAKCEKSVQTAAAKAEGKSGGNISCGSSYDETGICPGHPGLDYDAPGPSIFTHWSFSAGVCPIVGCIAISFQNGNLQVSGGVGPALSFPGVATGYNSRQLKTGFSQSNQVFGSSPVAQISYDINGRGLSLGSGPSAESGWGGGYVHAWAYGWHL